MAKGLIPISKKIWKLLNDQYNREIATAALFFEYCGNLDEFGMMHFSDLLYVWALEELHHAQRIFNYLKSRDSWAKTNDFIKPKPINDNDPKKVLKAITEYQRGVSDIFLNISENALNEKDYATYNFCEFFLKDQISEEKKCQDLNDAFKLSNDYLTIDKKIEFIREEYHKDQPIHTEEENT